MIKYKLKCESCENIFDSWFSSSKEFDKLKKINLLSCNRCNSLKVEKTLMSPKIISKAKNKSYKYNEKKIKFFKNKMREYQKFIKNNFEYVGNNFTYEARSIHYDNKKRKKGIYGTASKDEIKELRDEGIETEMIPWVEDKNN